MTPSLLILISLLAPLVGAICTLPMRGHQKLASALSLVTTLLSFIASALLITHTARGEVHVIHAGDWQAPFGIVLVVDGFSSIMLAVCQFVILAALIFCSSTLSAHYKRRHLFPLILTLSLGINGAFLTGDLFNLYVWFEVLLLSSFALMALMRGDEGRSAAWRYVVINLISSLLFLTAAGLIYGKTGTLNFAELRLRFIEAESSFLIDSSAALLFGAFGIKAALIPLAFWLPRSYPLLPPALSALFAGLLTKVGLYAFFRIFGMVFSNGKTFPHQDILFWLAIITMIGGVLGAVAQTDMRRILSFHIISQVGYMALALAIFNPLAIAAGIFYLAHHILVKANLFLTASLVEEHAGSSKIGTTRGIITTSPVIAILFAIPALSLAGLPPLSGFFAKFSLLNSALNTNEWLAATAIILVGLLTVFSMLKIWRTIFWGEPTNPNTIPPRNHLLATSAALSFITISIGLFADPLMTIATDAAQNIINPDAYLRAVLTPQSS